MVVCFLRRDGFVLQQANTFFKKILRLSIIVIDVSRLLITVPVCVYILRITDVVMMQKCENLSRRLDRRFHLIIIYCVT